jgi:hypothetical protein
MHKIWAAYFVTPPASRRSLDHVGIRFRVFGVDRVSPTPRTPASPRPPCHTTRQPASARRWPSQAFLNKGMARSGPGRVALVVGSAELEVAASAAEIGRSLHHIPLR